MGQRTIYSSVANLVAHPDPGAATNSFVETTSRNPTRDATNPLRVLISQRGTTEAWGSADQLAAFKAEQMAETALPHSFAKAKDRYYASVKHVFETIKDGAESKDLVWRNTCKWLQSGRVGLYVLSPIDDKLNAVKDLQAQAPYSNLRAYFGGNAVVRLDGDTPERVGFSNYGQATLQDPNVRGSYLPTERKIVIVDPALHPAELKRTLLIVVQDAVEPMAPSSLEQKFARALTKRWIGGDHADAEAYYDPQQVSDNKRRLGFQSPRQNLLIDDILKNDQEMQAAWNDIQRAAFRVTGPRGTNVINSGPIDDLTCVVRKKPTDHSALNPAVKAAVAKLDSDDKRAISDQAVFWGEFLRSLDHLTDDEKNDIAAQLHLPPPIVPSHAY